MTSLKIVLPSNDFPDKINAIESAKKNNKKITEIRFNPSLFRESITRQFTIKRPIAIDEKIKGNGNGKIKAKT
ncbi:MAG: hypothetical protein AAF348_16010 [Bacteroidota bacterium]